MSEQQPHNGSLEGLGKHYKPVLYYMPKENLRTEKLSVRVIDPETYRLIEIEKLYEAINFTKTRIGAFALKRSLIQPLTSAEVISAKQDSLRELQENPQLKETLLKYVDMASQQEDRLYDYFQGRYARGFMNEENRPGMYDVFKGAHEFLRHLGNGAEGIKASSDYLKFLIVRLDNYRDSEVFEFIKGPVYETKDGLKTKNDTRMYIPSIKFRPTDLTVGRTIMTSIGALGMGVGALSAISLGRNFDDSMFVNPLRQLYVSDPHVAEAIDSLGLIDELLSLDAYKNAVNVLTVLPTVTDSKTHHFVAKDLRNPVLIRQEKPYVPNDVELDGQKITILTGPNSGGKTSLCKTIAQTQVLAQIGGYIPAKEASISVADGIFYHSPMVNTLQDQEGRFGVEIARTRDIFYKTTPKSLVILDELIEATTYEERLQHSYNILHGFWQIGGNTILVTHNHQLAEEINKEGKGQFLQIEFNGGKFTHKTIPGISTESHAEEVLERLGFTKNDIQIHLNRLKSMPITAAQEAVEEKDEQAEVNEMFRKMRADCEDLLNSRGEIKKAGYSREGILGSLIKRKELETSIVDKKGKEIPVVLLSSKIKPTSSDIRLIVGKIDYPHSESDSFLVLGRNRSCIARLVTNADPRFQAVAEEDYLKGSGLEDIRKWREVVDALKNQNNQSSPVEHK